MSLGPEDKRFLDLIAENFAVCTVVEYIEFVKKLSGIVVANPVLESFRAILEKTRNFFENEKVEDSVKELLSAWSDFIKQIPKSSMPELQLFALYLWNVLHITFLVKMDVTNPQFQAYSMNLIERAQDNCAIAQKAEHPKAAVYFLKLIAEKYLDLFQYGQRNKANLEKALDYTDQAVSIQEKYADFPGLIQSYSFSSFLMNQLSEFYVEADPVKYQELIEMSYQNIMKGVEMARKKTPKVLAKILIDASANVSQLGRIQRDAEAGRKYIEESMVLAKEGIAKLNPKDKEYNMTAEGLYNNLGISYSYLGDLMKDLPKAMEMLQASLDSKLKAFDCAKKSGIKQIMVRDLTNISQSYYKMAILERDTPEKLIAFLQKSIQYSEEAQKLGEKLELDPSSERNLLQNGERLSSLYEKLLLMEKEHEKKLNWLSKKLNQDRKNIQLARQWKINPIRIAENILKAAESIGDATNKLDSVMIIRDLYQEAIDLLLEACKILEDAKVDDEKLMTCYRKICYFSQESSRIQPDLQRKYDALIFGKTYGEKALEIAEKLNDAYSSIAISDNYGLLVHDIGHALEITDSKKAWEFFEESIKIFQKGLSIAKDTPDSIASQAVLLDYIGGSYRDLANLSKELPQKKEFLMKSAEVKEDSLKLFEEYQKAPFDTAVTADSLAITLHQLGSIEDDPKKAIEVFSKAMKVTARAAELYTVTRTSSKAFRCHLMNLIELAPKKYLNSIQIEQNAQQRWDLLSKARASLEEGFKASEVSPVYRSSAEYLLWEYPQLVDQGIDVGGFKLL
ncbi:MAG: hypothetical protein LUQ65_00605, partial [Candidatus Helarchaeota archaeon]|nr:hypothetical protein [Candidatus Helarchaeota archaeon]